MIIAIPTLGEKGSKESVAEHFGRCPTYTLLDDDGNILKIIPNTSSHMGGTALPPKLLSENGVNILLCHGIGPKAIELCKEYDIDTYVDHSPTVQELFDKWKSKILSIASLKNACKEHHS